MAERVISGIEIICIIQIEEGGTTKFVHGFFMSTKSILTSSRCLWGISASATITARRLTEEDFHQVEIFDEDPSLDLARLDLKDHEGDNFGTYDPFGTLEVDDELHTFACASGACETYLNGYVNCSTTTEDFDELGEHLCMDFKYNGQFSAQDSRRLGHYWNRANLKGARKNTIFGDALRVMIPVIETREFVFANNLEGCPALNKDNEVVGMFVESGSSVIIALNVAVLKRFYDP